MPELPEMEAWRRALDDPVAAFPIEKAGPAHVATLKTFDPPLSALDGRGSRGEAPGQAAPLPDRGRRARPARPPDVGRPPPLSQSGRERAEDAGVPAAVRGRRAARPHRGRPEEARRSLAAHARRGRGGARAPRPGGARARRGASRRDPGRPAAAAALPAPRPAGDRRHRPRVGERDPARGEAVPFRPGPGTVPGQVQTLADAIDSELERGLELRERGAKDARSTASTTSSASPATRAARRSPASTSKSTRSTTAPSARPQAASSRTAGCHDCCADVGATRRPLPWRRRPGLRAARRRSAAERVRGGGFRSTDRLRELLDDDPAQANAFGDDGFQPLGLASFFGHVEAARLLLDRGADPNTLARNEHIQAGPLHSASASENKDAETRYELCELLLDRGADPNLEQGGGFTALDAARENGDERLERLLLDRGART